MEMSRHREKEGKERRRLTAAAQVSEIEWGAGGILERKLENRKMEDQETEREREREGHGVMKHKNGLRRI